MSRLDLVDVTKSYGPVEVLHRTSVTIGEEETFAILGPSGCGKSTLLALVAGLIAPTAGEVRFEGRPLTNVPAERRGFPMVFQDHLLFPGMTVAENVAFGLRARSLGRAEREARVAAALAAVHLEGFEPRYPAALSGGQKQRVALARAIVLRPRVLLLDEPFSNLDSALRHDMRELVSSTRRAFGFSVLMVTHDPQEAIEMADRLAVMRAGKIEQSGRPVDVYREPVNAFVARFLGPANILPTRDGDVCVRPENVTLSLEGPGISAQVVRKRFMGPRVEVILDSGRGEIRALDPHPERDHLPVGTNVSVSWRDEDATRLSPEDRAPPGAGRPPGAAFR